jgi:hypothetical protein
MEDLLEKFYGKPKSKGSAGAPVPDESTPQPEPEPKPQHDPQLEQRVSHIESQLSHIGSQLQQMAETQKTILSRLDTESQQAPELVWQSALRVLRKAWKEFRPEPGELSTDDGTPLRWDSVHRRLHIMDDASEEGTSAKKDSGRKIRCACTACGRRIGLRSAQMVRATLRSPASIHCPRCYGKNRQARQRAYAMAGVAAFALLIIIAGS